MRAWHQSVCYLLLLCVAKQNVECSGILSVSWEASSTQFIEPSKDIIKLLEWLLQYIHHNNHLVEKSRQWVKVNMTVGFQELKLP